MVDTRSLLLLEFVAGLVAEVASALLEKKAKRRGRPSPPAFSPLWTVRSTLILTGALVFAAGAAIWNSLLIMEVGAGIAVAGILLGLADKLRRAFTDW